MTRMIHRLATVLSLAVGMALPLVAQTVNEGDYGRDAQRPTLMAPIEPASSSVRPPEPQDRAEQIDVMPEGEWTVTRMQSTDPLASSSVRLDASDSAEVPGDTLEDVLARAAPERRSGFSLLGRLLQGSPRDDLRAAAASDDEPLFGPLATRGTTSDAAIWSAIRTNTAEISTQVRGPATTVLVQDAGMAWLEFRRGPLLTWGGWLLIGTMAVLALFYLLRGRIRIEGHKTGLTIERFAFIERFGHWLMAGSFILLAVTGLLTLFGRLALIPLIGLEAWSPVATASKWVHNNVSWAFMAGLVMVFVMWVVHNIPKAVDLQWLAQGGGMFSRHSHPHAEKFNAGQKILFWLVILLGLSISVSGLSLLFPFDWHLFSHTFAWLNGTFSTDLPTNMPPQQEMMLTQIWHAITGFVFMAIILAHIYIGSVGMEGAFDAMGSGEVEVQWAREHHDLWYEKVTGRSAHEYIPPALDRRERKA